MEFLLLGGMILLMSLLDKVPAMREANKALAALQTPIGIVVFLKGISLFSDNLAFQGIMGLVAGVMLLTNLLRLIPKAEASIDKLSASLTALQVPIGGLTVVAAIIGMFSNGQ
jgi:hypothetical protein